MSSTRRRPVCPKCRALGLDHDCADQLVMHPQDTQYALEVTVRFIAPVTSSRPLDPVEMATYMREQWLMDEAQLADVLVEALDGDFDLDVAPSHFDA